MSDNGNVESHTIRLLQEMRGEIAEFRQEVRAGISEFLLRVEILSSARR